MLGSSLVLLLLFASEEKPVPKFSIDRETTYVTGPLDSEGYINYVAALNERLGQGITPDKNANALLWKALGPRPGGERMPPEYFKALGIEEPPEHGDYFIGLRSFVKDHLNLNSGEWEAVDNQHDNASQRAWAARDYPHIAAWLKVNAKPLAVVVEASKRSEYFNPLAARQKDKEAHGDRLIDSLLGVSVQRSRELESALSSRAMLRVGEGKFDDVWQDLLACHRLARLVGRGPFLIDALVGLALDGIASKADLAYIECASLTTKQVQDQLKELRRLAPMPAMADKIELGERCFFLDYVQLRRRAGIGFMDFFAGESLSKKPGSEMVKALEKIDWESALRSGNLWFNRQVAALRHKERVTREKEIAKVEEDFQAWKTDVLGPAKLLKFVLKRETRDNELAKAFGNVQVVLITETALKVQTAYDRLAQSQRNLYLAFALAAYRSDTGRHPAKLDELAPKYIDEIPDDHFSGKPLVYRPTENGYLLYSVGVNGKDEGGRGPDDDPQGDDLRVRMPARDMKKK